LKYRDGLRRAFSAPFFFGSIPRASPRFTPGFYKITASPLVSMMHMHGAA
jgi:hypothetical protein